MSDHPPASEEPASTGDANGETITNPVNDRPITIYINDVPVSVPRGATILDAAKAADVDIPTLCKHPDLPATAACGICIVKIGDHDQMMRSCCTPAVNGMKITTHTPEIVRVRRAVLEGILSAHPNECLTCLRNGSCELQLGKLFATDCCEYLAVSDLAAAGCGFVGLNLDDQPQAWIIVLQQSPERFGKI